VYCWGQNLRNQIGNGGTYAGYYTAVLSDPYGSFIDREVTSLSAGADHTCAIAGNRAFCWGYNASGQMGDGTTAMRNTPTAVDSSGLLGGKTAVSVYAGAAGTFVGYNSTPVVEPGMPPTSEPSFSVAAWGENSSGKLGDGTVNNALSPVSVLNSGSLTGKKISFLASGESHSCAISEGELHCWGANVSGQLGNLSTTASAVPTRVFADGYLRSKVVTDLTLGTNYTCVIADKQAYCWGVNSMGQTGNEASGFYYKAPVPVRGPLAGKEVTKIDAGNVHTCAVSEGKAFCWGYNTEGELGNGDASRARTYFPVEVSTAGVLNGKTVTDVSAGTWATCAIADSKPYCWGNNQQRQLGASTANSSSDIPVAVISTGQLSGKSVYAIHMGTYHACALANAKVYCWGNNTSGELGTGATTLWSADPLATNPSGLLNGKTVLAIGVGENHSCALTSESKSYCWGFGTAGKIGNGNTASSNTPLLVTDTGVLSGVTPSKLWVGKSSAFVGY
jgi:alpha-tubulin suppressor-like RCC1 family protein